MPKKVKRAGNAVTAALGLVAAMLALKDWFCHMWPGICPQECRVAIAQPIDGAFVQGSSEVVDVTGSSTCSYVFVLDRELTPGAVWTVTDQCIPSGSQTWACVANIQRSVDYEISAWGCNSPTCFSIGGHTAAPSNGIRSDKFPRVRRTTVMPQRRALLPANAKGQ
jgi:hypothetical protein